MLTIENVLILGGISLQDKDETFSVCELKFTISEQAPKMRGSGSYQEKGEELKE